MPYHKRHKEISPKVERLLSNIVDIGEQDIYTNCKEYQGRVAAMETLICLLRSVLHYDRIEGGLDAARHKALAETLQDTMENAISNAQLFTPRDKATGERYRMRVPTETRVNLSSRVLGYRGTITDELTGKRWKVYGAACGLPNCQCDAVVVPCSR